MRYLGEMLKVEKQPYGWVVVKGEPPDEGVISVLTFDHIVSLVFTSEAAAEGFVEAVKNCVEQLKELG